MKIMFSLLLSMMLCSCVEHRAETIISVEGQWVTPEEDIKLIERYAGTPDICFRLEDGRVTITSPVDILYLDYTVDDTNLYDIQAIGKVEVGDDMVAHFYNPLINNDVGDVQLINCIPYLY